MTKYVTNFCKNAIDHWATYEAVREEGIYEIKIQR